MWAAKLTNWYGKMRYYPHLDYLRGYIYNHGFPRELSISADMWAWCHEELNTMQLLTHRPVWATDPTGATFMFNGCVIRPIE
jgi:hypothetical protein